MRKSFVCVLLMLCALHLFTSCKEDIAKTWKLSPLETKETAGNEQEFKSGPFFMNWEAEEGTVLGFFEVKSIPGMVSPMVSSKMAESVKDITFEKDGNITVTYAVTDTDPSGAPQWQKTKPGYATYKIQDKQILIFPNIDNLISQIPETEANNPEVKTAIDLLKAGIPVNYTINGTKATLFIDKAFLEKIIPLIIKSADNADMSKLGGMAGLVKGLLQTIPATLQKTTKLEIGINLVEA